MNRKSRSITRRSSILKIDVNREDDTRDIGASSRRSSRRVSFAEMCQIKEFPRDSPKVYKDVHSEDVFDGKDAASSIAGSKNSGITGLDKLLTGAIQTPYQDVAEYPIPEMSSESFNIFDINKTVLDTVDMETTQVGGDIDTFLPQMDFQNEPSMEQKFDAYSFLRSLNGRQNNRMETMQIYSPKRAIGPSFASDFHIMEYNKENVIPMESLPSLNSDYQEPPASLDSKLFLQRLFGGATREVEESQNGMEMDDIACTDNTAKTLPTSVSSHNNDVTKYFDTEDVTVGIEETKCIGGIVVEGHHMDHDKENCVHFANQTLNMEETHPLGGILKAGNTASQSGLRMQQGYYTSITAEDNITRCFNMEGDADDDLEETKCVGGILNKVDKSYITSECVTDNLSTTRDLIESKNSRTLSNLKEKTSENVLSNMENDKNRKLNEDMTVNFNVTGLQDKMEETRTVGGFLDKTLNATRNEQQEHEARSFIYGKKDLVNDTVAMEETVPLGKILDSGHSSCHFDQSQVKMSLTPAEQLLRSVTTSESKQVQGISRESTDDKLNISGIQREEMEFTKNFTVPMEITKPVSEFFDKSRSVGGDGPDNSLNYSVMEETKAVGGILDNSIHKTTVDNRTDKDKIDKTIDYTVEMEETRATGRILEKLNSEMDNLGEKPTSNAKNAYVPISIEKMKTVGGNLNKTLDRTVVFDDVDTNWLSEDLKPESIGKAADGTTADVVNKTLGIEETNCLGGILTSDMEVIKENAENIYYHAHASEDDKTTMETVQMEETRCVTKETTCELSQKIVNESLNNQPELYQSSTRNFFKAAQAESVLNVNSNENETGKTAVNDKFDSGDIIVDDEITLKFSNKRNFEEYSGEKQDKGQEKTKEITQTGLAKLKEQLILSKRKTAHSLRQGDIRTPSKFSPLFPASAPGSTSKSTSCSKLHLGETRSPVHKRQRLSDGMQAVDEFGTNERSKSMASPTGDIEGIDDEQMPDTMHLDLCTSSSTADIHRDKNSTVQSDRVSTTVQEAYETHSSGNDTRNSSSVNLSLFSNKSFAYSTVVPDGPLSLESFFKLTFTLSSKVQGTRCSTVFAPNIDMDDLGEVLNAELTLTPMVQAKKKMKELFLQQIQKSKDEMEWLEKSLEETQPEIFQKCAKASSEELQEITGQLRSLLSACHTEARIAWKEGTKQMLTEALHDIQGTGVRRAEEMLETVHSDSQTLDNILTSLDDELASLDEKERKLEELQNKQDILNREMEKLSLALQQKSVEESDLYSELSKRQQADEVVTSLKQDILSHLMCCEWNLVKMEEDTLEFSFLDDKLNLVVSFSPGVQEKQISNIVWKSQSPSKVLGYFEDRVAVELALNGINTTALKQKFATFSAVPELMHEVSSSVNEIKRFCEDLEDVHLYHMLTFQNNSICTELWDRETQDFITVSFRFDPGHPLTSHAEPSAAVKIGTLKSCDIEDALRAVIPGPGYLSRLIKAVDFKQLKNISASK